MPSLRVVTVKSSSGDYSSLNSAESGEQGDLVSLDRQLDIECYAFSDTTGTSISGWTTDSTRYIRIFAATGEGHAGVWNTSKYRLLVATNNARALTISEEYVRLEGLQVEETSVAAAREAILISGTANAASSDIRINRCLVRGSGTESASFYATVSCTSGKTTIRNSIIYGNTVGAGLLITAGANTPTVDVDNCTFAGHTTYGVNRSSGTVTLRNCYSGGNGTDDYNGTITRTTCMHSSATSFSGSTASTAHSTANFTNVTGGSQDYHLVGGSALIDQGTDLSGTFTDDVDGDTRSGTFDVGADEYVAAASGTAYPSNFFPGGCLYVGPQAFHAGGNVSF